MLRIGRLERDAIGKEIEGLADEIRAVAVLATSNEKRTEKLRLLQNRLDSLRDQLGHVRGRT